MPAIDKIHVKDQNGTEQVFPIGAEAVNVTFNPDATGGSPNSVNTRIQDTVAHMNKKAVTDSVGVHGLRYNTTSNKLQVEVTPGSQSDAGGGGEGDMTKAEFVNPQSNLLLVSKGGTGNANGYVQIGALAGSTIGDKATAEGEDTTSSGITSHAEGERTSAIGGQSHAEGQKTYAKGVSSHAEGGYSGSMLGEAGTFATGNSSHAEGYYTSAIGDYSHAEGENTCARGMESHAEGSSTYATEHNSHAEGRMTTASNQGSHAEGMGTYASGLGSHAEGSETCAQGKGAHAEGGYIETTGVIGGTFAIGDNSHAEGYSTTAFGPNSHAEGFYTYAAGIGSHAGSHAEGAITTAFGNNSHAEGYSTYAIGDYSHAEGAITTAFGNNSHAEGNSTCAIGDAAHTEGEFTLANYKNAHAEGDHTQAKANSSHAGGAYTISSNIAAYAIGHLNANMTGGGTIGDTVGTAFVIGNGTSTANKSNAFVVEYNGTVRYTGTPQNPNQDYAEFFEQKDNNSQNEDRVGYFITFDEGKKIKIASPEDDYILGITSGAPSVLGNGDCSVQNGMVMRDEFNRIQYEPAPLYELNEETGELEPVLDDEGNPVYQGTKPVYNPDYDPSQPYIPRDQRPEWAAVGMLGVLPVRDDGTCEVNGYCTVAEGGIATKAANDSVNKYRVIGRKTENVVEVVFR